MAKKESELGRGADSPPGLLPDVTVPSANSISTSSKCVSPSESACRRTYVYLQLMGNFTIRKTCVDAVFSNPADCSGTLLLQFDQQSVGTGGPDIVRGMVNRVQVKGLTGFDRY